MRASITNSSFAQRAGLKKKPLLFRVPINSTKFSKLWVSLFGKTHYELASPLIDSLLCELPQDPPSDLILPFIHELSFAGMLEKILQLPVQKNEKAKRKLIHPNSVRSIQRLPSLASINCDDIALEYEAWLPKAMLGLLKIESDTNGFIKFSLRGLPWPLLILKPILDGLDLQRSKFHIVGGLLSKHSDCGWLEFRQIANRKFTLVSINEFVPTLPWYIYRITQAVLHKWTMNSFARHLQRDTWSAPPSMRK